MHNNMLEADHYYLKTLQFGKMHNETTECTSKKRFPLTEV